MTCLNDPSLPGVPFHFLRVDVDEMAIAIYLPVARFRKASIQKVFADSRRKI